jgi:ferredoxin
VRTLAERNGLPAGPLHGFVRLAANESCTACGICSRVCPTRALRLEVADDRFELTFDSGACADCRL